MGAENIQIFASQCKFTFENKTSNNANTVREKFALDHLQQTWHADSESAISISIGRNILPETVMTSFTVGIKTHITRERYEMDKKLLQNANSKSGSAFQKTYFSTSPDAPFML